MDEKNWRAVYDSDEVAAIRARYEARADEGEAVADVLALLAFIDELELNLSSADDALQYPDA